MRHRPGLTLIELVVTVTIIALLLFIGASSLRSNEIEKTRDGGFDVVELMRRARYQAARSNLAVVIQVQEFGAALAGGGTTRGRLDAYVGADDTCPQAVSAASAVLGTVDFGAISAGDDPAPGIALVTPAGLTGAAANAGFCIRPNGRIVANADGRPIRPTGTATQDMAGKAHLYVQWDPVRIEDDALVVPFIEIEVPFNGLVRIPQ